MGWANLAWTQYSLGLTQATNHALKGLQTGQAMCVQFFVTTYCFFLTYVAELDLSTMLVRRLHMLVTT